MSAVLIRHPSAVHRIKAPELRGNNLSLGWCRDREVYLDGPAGCIAGETRIYNPATGEHMPVKELYDKKIAPIVQTLMGAMQAEVPFCKGVRCLYRVMLASGRQCVVTDNHLFLTPDGWRFASSCLPSQRLLVALPCPLQSIEVSGPLVSLQDALRLSRIPLGSQEYCSVYSRLYDERPQWEEDIASVVAPSQDDAHEHSHVDFCMDDRETLSGYSHQDQQYGLHARMYYSPLLDDKDDALCYALQEISSQVDALFRFGVPSLKEKAPLLPIAQSLPCDGSTFLRELWSKGYSVLSASSTHDDREYQAVRQSWPHFLSADKMQELPASVQELGVCSLSNSASDIINSSNKYNYMAQWDTVSSIEYERTDEYFDLHVPVAEHYLAEGIWHHNTGKTVAALYKIHRLLSTYPGSRALVSRKTNTALTGSAMVTYRDNVLNQRRDIRWFGGNKVRPPAYCYPNGSEMIVNGLDKPEKVLSAEFDWAYINEVPECNEEDVEFVRMRLRPRTGGPNVPYRQLVMDGNPGPPTHWMNQRMNEGRTTRLLSRHEDNPRYFDLKTNAWTEEGQEYIFGILEGLTGVRYARYRLGLWAAAEGTVYEDVWDRARNVVAPLEIPRSWPRYLSIDFGYTNPFVCLWAAQDPDGRLIVYRQIYRTKKIVEDHCKDIAIASGWFHLLPRDYSQYCAKPADWADPLPREVIADHDAEDRATFERHLQMMVTPAKKTVSDGIQAVAARLRAAGDGKSRLMIVRDSLVERDEERARNKLPVCLEDEPEMYVWKRGADGSSKEEPVKEHDHALDACRYLVARFDLMPGGVSYFRDIWR